jgi:hypothetical protein
MTLTGQGASPKTRLTKFVRPWKLRLVKTQGDICRYCSTATRLSMERSRTSSSWTPIVSLGRKTLARRTRLMMRSAQQLSVSASKLYRMRLAIRNQRTCSLSQVEICTRRSSSKGYVASTYQILTSKCLSSSLSLYNPKVRSKSWQLTLSTLRIWLITIRRQPQMSRGLHVLVNSRSQLSLCVRSSSR